MTTTEDAPEYRVGADGETYRTIQALGGPGEFPPEGSIPPQPAPVPNDRVDIQTLVIEDIAARRQHGIATYGEPLQAFNGRDALRDAYEEALDLVMYLKQLRVEDAERTAHARAQHPDLVTTGLKGQPTDPAEHIAYLSKLVEDAWARNNILEGRLTAARLAEVSELLRYRVMLDNAQTRRTGYSRNRALINLKDAVTERLAELGTT